MEFELAKSIRLDALAEVRTFSIGLVELRLMQPLYQIILHFITMVFLNSRNFDISYS